MRSLEPLVLTVVGLLALATDSRAECPAAGTVDRNGWEMSWEVTASDMLRVYDASFHGTPALTSAKVVEWHSDYGTSGFVLSLGCGGSGGGFPVSFYDVQVADLPPSSRGAGFEITADFRMSNWGASCNYRFDAHYRFWEDGSFRLLVGAYGKTCGANEVNRPVLRIDIAEGDPGNDRIQTWNGTDWSTVTTETFRTPYAGANGPILLDPTNAALRIVDVVTGRGHVVEPNVGQLDDVAPADDAFLYFTLHDAAEGDGDLGVLGGCCNDTQAQGPDAYLDGESLDGADVVLWYVPQFVTDDSGPDYACWTVTGEPNPETYPCFGGPLFRPTWPLFSEDFESGGLERWFVTPP
jgi:hypothetical protein